MTASVKLNLSLKILILIMASMLKYGQQEHDVCAYSICSVRSFLWQMTMYFVPSPCQGEIPSFSFIQVVAGASVSLFHSLEIVWMCHSIGKIYKKKMKKGPPLKYCIWMRYDHENTYASLNYLLHKVEFKETLVKIFPQNHWLKRQSFFSFDNDSDTSDAIIFQSVRQSGSRIDAVLDWK